MLQHFFFIGKVNTLLELEKKKREIAEKNREQDRLGRINAEKVR